MLIRLLALVLAPIVAGCGDQEPGAVSDSGVVGTVLLGPTCPVETVEDPCEDQPPEAGTRVIVAERLPGEAYAAGETVSEGTTSADGTFRIEVAPGEYVVTAEAGMSCEIMDIVVAAGEFTTMDVVCDTGIRTPATG
jgi:hypothetical protein